MSTRGNVQTGDNVLISGVILQGPVEGDSDAVPNRVSAPENGSTKRAILRAMGPSLTGSGVTNVLADPYLELYDEAGALVLPNDNWRDTQEQEIEETGLAPENDLESAIVFTFLPGNYTAVMSGVNGGTGVGLTEIYDLERESGRVGNISTRGIVSTGNNVLIGGFILEGTGSADLLVRAIGPSMTTVPNRLLDPTLELTDANGNVTFNDDWRDDQEAAIDATTIPPSDDREAAIRATLSAGPYTAIVRGKENTTGVALVEIYSLQSSSGD